MKKRLLSLALALIMALALLPATAFAAEDKSVTDHNVTLSDVILPDEYDPLPTFPADLGFPEGYYNLGRIGFPTEDGDYGFETFGCYLVPNDAVLSFELGKDEAATVWFFTLKDVTEGGASAKSYEATEIGSLTSDKSATMDKSLMKEYREAFDLVVCRVGDDPNNDVFVMFPFVDVLANDWYAANVDWAVEQNLTTGTAPGKFDPTLDCTHGQILTFLYRAERGEGTASGDDMAKAIAWATTKGMIDESFEFGAKCTRAQAVNYIWQAKDKPKAKEASKFTDVPTDAEYADAVSWAVEAGVTKGTDPEGTVFDPDTVCQRGHIVTFLSRAYKD